MSSSKKHGLFIYNDGIQDSSDDVTISKTDPLFLSMKLFNKTCFFVWKIECGSAGSHFNPLKSNHGNINNSVRHIGDYGNS